MIRILVCLMLMAAPAAGQVIDRSSFADSLREEQRGRPQDDTPHLRKSDILAEMMRQNPGRIDAESILLWHGLSSDAGCEDYRSVMRGNAENPSEILRDIVSSGISRPSEIHVARMVPYMHRDDRFIRIDDSRIGGPLEIDDIPGECAGLRLAGRDIIGRLTLEVPFEVGNFSLGLQGNQEFIRMTRARTQDLRTQVCIQVVGSEIRMQRVGGVFDVTLVAEKLRIVLLEGEQRINALNTFAAGWNGMPEDCHPDTQNSYLLTYMRDPLTGRHAWGREILEIGDDFSILKRFEALQ